MTSDYVHISNYYAMGKTENDQISCWQTGEDKLKVSRFKWSKLKLPTVWSLFVPL